ncbi:hypothetical protein [Runella slithyformis]|uniref:VRR-NUC domain-containing protein n=1 Tax=Runella slithyformis (strain ATCC 29530 / DSM 19594 / LMG 11500 / NCIMB 11436 / LSU 4) TaxID=761193 RepID=A0A7U3ZN37_RUNSL|nr:hypothetical protein [Runella slithyformis]AEI50247.1 hypothetical protein Runsl_3890 [Runella slithyformis DSM 19594]
MNNQPAPEKELTPATALTLQIIDFLNQKGHYATRILTAGIYNEETGQWEKSGVERGTADIHACIFSVHVSIEIKKGRDNIRKKQARVRQRVIDAGGQYIAIRDLAEFQSWYQSIALNLKPQKQCS